MRVIWNDGCTAYDDVWRIDTSFSFSNLRPFKWIIPVGVMIFLLYPFYRRAGKGLRLIPKTFLGILVSFLGLLGVLLLIPPALNDSLKEDNIFDEPFTQCLILLIGLVFGVGNMAYVVCKKTKIPNR